MNTSTRSLSFRALRSGFTLLLAILPVLSACSTPNRAHAVPEELTAAASIPGLPGIRYYLNEDLEAMLADLVDSTRREREHLDAIGHTGPLPPVHFLALSGGGDNGAFGAGLLAGWTQAGDRPEFQVVTGISIGALIAPFAFLGPSEDGTLEKLFTTLGPEDVYEKRGFLSVLNDDAVTDCGPMKKLLEECIDEELLARIAKEYGKGRWLLVATTNLDASRPVVWNMGKLAASGAPGALPLFRDILRASASIPGVFSPVMFDVEAGGVAYQEMHVDGGIAAQVFLFPTSLSHLAHDREAAPDRERHAYIIRNATLDREWAEVERSVLSISGRSVSSLIQTQGVGDLFRIYVSLQDHDVDFNLAIIGSDFTTPHPEEFDTGYMRALHAYGRELGRGGYPWLKSPAELATRLGMSLSRLESPQYPAVALP